jgi:NAD(P)-dependent dehydrogenase (short-subunit alcohol dehydrogenase family)
MPSNHSKSMTGKICMVTGATSGIGKVTAYTLASRGAELIVAGRNQQKAEDTVRWIKSGTGNDIIHYLLADFSDLQQVREMATIFRERYERLDVLVNNAGAFFNTRQKTPYGVEMTLLVNHLAPFLLTNMLLDRLKSSPQARIVNVSSDAHKYDTMDFNDLGFNRGYSGMKGYARSKLANILFTYELARRLSEYEVTANALHPGHIATDIWRTNFSIIGPVLKWVMSFFALSPEEGADNTIYLASSPEVKGLTGKYFVKREAVPSSPISYDKNVVQRLWEISAGLTSSEAT